MTLIKSISGFRGTIGGVAGDNLTPVDIVECTAAFGQRLFDRPVPKSVVIGRDGRISGHAIKSLVAQTLIMMGIDVLDLDYSTTPTVEIAIPLENAGGGIILTASHNPENWNALKLFNEKGEFISGEEAAYILDIIKHKSFSFAGSEQFGEYRIIKNYIDKHIEQIAALNYLDIQLIRKKRFHATVDCINSTGAHAIPKLLNHLGVKYQLINADVHGKFVHNPEPLPENLEELSHQTLKNGSDIGIAVDPDVDRLALICPDGSSFGEEYTLVAAADFVLSKKKGPTVSNLSSTRALRDITEKHGQKHYSSRVGEMHVVKKMKEVKAIIGGEGNGGVILPELHYGRDALAGIALILNLLAEKDTTLNHLKNEYPTYHMTKSKVEAKNGQNLDVLLEKIASEYRHEKLNWDDGLKIDFAEEWVHLRKSNTEPVIRIYSESRDAAKSEALCRTIMSKLI